MKLQYYIVVNVVIHISKSKGVDEFVVKMSEPQVWIETGGTREMF